jgi:hypothetical protein
MLRDATRNSPLIGRTSSIAPKGPTAPCADPPGSVPGCLQFARCLRLQTVPIRLGIGRAVHQSYAKGPGGGCVCGGRRISGARERKDKAGVCVSLNANRARTISANLFSSREDGRSPPAWSCARDSSPGIPRGAPTRLDPSYANRSRPRKRPSCPMSQGYFRGRCCQHRTGATSDRLSSPCGPIVEPRTRPAATSQRVPYCSYSTADIDTKRAALSLPF